MPQRHPVFRAVAWVLVVSFLASACASRSVPPIGAAGRPFKPEADERQLWAQAEKEEEKLLKRVKVYDDPLLEEYLGRVGDRLLPALGVGYDGQGFDYSPAEKRFHDRQRGFFLVATQELGLPGLQAHPSFNISDFDSNSICGAIPLSYNIRDKAQVFFEWDNINDFNDSRVNSGLRVYLTPKLRADFAVRRIGQGGVFSDNTSRGPERVVQLKYTGSF